MRVASSARPMRATGFVLFFVFSRGIKSQPLLFAQPPAGGALSWSSNVTGFHSGRLALLLFLYQEEAAAAVAFYSGIFQELASCYLLIKSIGNKAKLLPLLLITVLRVPIIAA